MGAEKMRAITRGAFISIILLLFAAAAFPQGEAQPQDIAYLRVLALIAGLIATGMTWKWYFSTFSRPPVLLWFGIGMVAELFIKLINITQNAPINSSPELLTAFLQVVAGAFFLTGLWAFLCTRWIKASSSLSKYFLLMLAVVIAVLLGYGVLNGPPGSEEMIKYAIYVLTSFWMLLYVFITLMALYAYIRTDEMMLAWFSAGFSMMVFASWYRILFMPPFFRDALLPEQQAVSLALPLVNSVCYIIGVYIFQRAGKA